MYEIYLVTIKTKYFIHRYAFVWQFFNSIACFYKARPNRKKAYNKIEECPSYKEIKLADIFTPHAFGNPPAMMIVSLDADITDWAMPGTRKL